MDFYWRCIPTHPGRTSKQKPCYCEEERRNDLVAMQIGRALATRLPRCARNDIVFIGSFGQVSTRVGATFATAARGGLIIDSAGAERRRLLCPTPNKPQTPSAFLQRFSMKTQSHGST